MLAHFPNKAQVVGVVPCLLWAIYGRYRQNYNSRFRQLLRGL
jgi:hypothetical protein